MALTQISTAGVKDDAVTAGKIPADAIGSSEIAANAVGSSELADNAVDTAAIADQAVALSKLPHGDGSSDGKFLRANNGADPTFETVSIPAGTTINNNADNRVITGSGTANTLNAETNAVIDSTGRLLVGTGHSASRNVGDLTAKIQLEGAGYNQASLSLMSNAGASAGNTAHFTLGKSRGSSNGDNTVIADNDALGQIQFAGADGTDCNSVAASIVGRVDGTPGSNDMPGRLVFSTTADGAAAPTERMRIDSSGNVGINETSPQQQLHVHDDTIYNGILINGNGAPRIAFARSTTTTGEWSAGVDGTNGNNFAITNSNDNSNRKLIISSTGVTSSGTLSAGGHCTTFGNFVVGTSGNGIDFSATSDASSSESTTSMSNELFDDYEVGTWQPTWSPASGSITPLTRHGDYVKIGRTVHCMFAISANSSSGESGELKITGLPFSATIPNANGPRGGGGVVFAGAGMNGDISQVVASGTTLRVKLTNNAYLQTNSSGVSFGYNASQISGMFSFLTAS